MVVNGYVLVRNMEVEVSIDYYFGEFRQSIRSQNPHSSRKGRGLNGEPSFSFWEAAYELPSFSKKRQMVSMPR